MNFYEHYFFNDYQQVQFVLVGLTETLDELAEKADRMLEYTSVSKNQHPEIYGINHQGTSDNIQQLLILLTEQVTKLSTSINEILLRLDIKNCKSDRKLRSHSPNF